MGHWAQLPRVGLGLALIVAACGPSLASNSPSPLSTRSGISIPEDQLSEFDRCMLDHGFRIAEVHLPSFEGDRPSYVFESDYPAEQGMALLVECRSKYAPYHEKTPAELREVYDRWVEERDCLTDLGYQPVDPPSFEKFASDWRTGPWMPIDGVDTEAWTDAEYREAKERCTLEMYDRS